MCKKYNEYIYSITINNSTRYYTKILLIIAPDTILYYTIMYVTYIISFNPKIPKI